MKFEPKSEEQIKMESLLPKGRYLFEVMEASNEKSKNGNDMIKVKLNVYPRDPDATPRMLTDYLLEKMAYKLRHFCDVTGLLQKYNAGTLEAIDCEGRHGTCLIDIAEDKDGKYPPKNEIKDYGVEKAPPSSGSNGSASPAKSNEPEMAEHDIKF